MPDLALEDFSVGDVLTGEPVTVTRDAIVTFARAFDFQPFHTDEAAAGATFAGRLIASGWHTASLGMRLLQAGPFRGGSSLGAPGIDELRWLAPVLPGDSLCVRLTITSLRDSASKPGLGFVGTTLALENGRGETVMTQRFTFMLARGAPTPCRRAPSPSARRSRCPSPTTPRFCPSWGRRRSASPGSSGLTASMRRPSSPSRGPTIRKHSTSTTRRRGGRISAASAPRAGTPPRPT